jgi:hypothetical protein
LDRASRVLAAIREDNLPDRFAAITTAATALHRLNLGDRTAVVDQLAEAAYGYGLEHDAIQVAIAMGSCRRWSSRMARGRAVAFDPMPNSTARLTLDVRIFIIRRRRAAGMA